MRPIGFFFVVLYWSGLCVGSLQDKSPGINCHSHW